MSCWSYATDMLPVSVDVYQVLRIVGDVTRLLPSRECLLLLLRHVGGEEHCRRSRDGALCEDRLPPIWLASLLPRHVASEYNAAVTLVTRLRWLRHWFVGVGCSVGRYALLMSYRA